MVDLKEDVPSCGINLYHRVIEITCQNNRMCAITIKMDDGRVVLIVCCYMPNDSMSRTNVNVEFVDTCMDLQNMIDSVAHDDVILNGDWNTDFSRNSAQTRYLKQFMDFIQMKCSWDHDNSVKEDTFYAFNGNGSSCIDYYLMTEGFYNEIVIVYCYMAGY